MVSRPTDFFLLALSQDDKNRAVVHHLKSLVWTCTGHSIVSQTHKVITIIYTQNANPRFISTISNSLQAKVQGGVWINDAFYEAQTGFLPEKRLNMAT
jgi:hypothetical protein